MAEEIRFDQPLLEGIRNSNFFNGRFLTAEALQTEQTATAARLGLLGQAVGAGVAWGLAVTPVDPKTTDSPAVKLNVTAGLAINEQGQTISLGKDVEIPLAVTEQAGDTQCNGDFDDCGRLTVKKADAGLYLVTIAPASGYDTRERSPMTGPADDGKITGCGYKYRIEGVLFQLKKVELPAIKRDALLRNLAAHYFLNTGSRKELLRRLREPESKLTARQAEVPLALVQWESGSIQFVDMWAVRRRCAPRPDMSLSPFSPLNEYRLAQAEAVFLQFQDHIRSIQIRDKSIGPARETFRYLPPAGILPVSQVESFIQGFEQVTLELLDPVWYRRLVHDSLFLPPVDLNDELAVTVILPAAGGSGRDALRRSSLYLVETDDVQAAEEVRSLSRKTQEMKGTGTASKRLLVQSKSDPQLDEALKAMMDRYEQADAKSPASTKQAAETKESPGRMRLFAVEERGEALFLITSPGDQGKGPWNYVGARFDYD